MNVLRFLGVILMTWSIAVHAAGPSVDSDDAAGGVLSGTAWTLVALAGQPIDPAAALTLRFESGQRLGGFDGCNHFHGSFRIDGSSIHIPAGMAATQAACPDPLASRARTFLETLGRAATFVIEADGLSLRDAGGQQLAAFVVTTTTLAGSDWEVIACNNGKQGVVTVIIGTHISAHFGDDGRVTGSAGCNNYFAEFKTSGESISIGPAGATHMFCNDPAGVMEQESLYLQALASAATFRLEGDRLTLRRADGAIALTLARESVTPDPAD